MEKYKIDFTKSHTAYKDNEGNQVISVTTALGLLEKYGLHYYYWKRGKDGIAYNAEDEAARIGTIVHALIMCELKGMELDTSNLSQEQIIASRNSKKSYDDWVSKKTLEPILIEKPLVSNRWGYGGTPDFVGYVDGDIELWDYKSSKDIYDDYIPQLIGYAKMVIENKIVKKLDRLVIVNIPKTADGNFKVASYDMRSSIMAYYFKILIKCVELAKIYEIIKKMKKGY